MTEKTIFEKIVDREIPARIVYEDDAHIAFLDVQPFEKGHILVVPKKSYVTVWEMPETEFLALQKIVYMVVQKVHNQIGGGINIHQNNLPSAHQEVPHVHFHVIPRNENKSVYTTGFHSEYESDQEADQFLELLRL